jgi:hypothetical protein
MVADREGLTLGRVQNTGSYACAFCVFAIVFFWKTIDTRTDFVYNLLVDLASSQAAV